ncbi:hypothetical protein [Portibacter lacus]|uniref:Uncharacterized protein n=1 Tax=Portibacter lacus TaxID=1099794 RepID=A0AA37SVD3_9BACT|nr:hypothetical protein [Portibacter lacus]GLR18500.1 hypothetical protein GCM10007940_31160 [Portibacter lacus]
MSMHYFKALLFLSLVISSCTVPTLDEVDLDGEYAVPLINSKVSIGDLFEEGSDLKIIALQDGTLSLQYHEELISESINQLLPSIPSIGEVEIIDTVSYFPIATNGQFILSKALLSGDEMRFRYTHDKDEDVSVHLKIPELTKDGKIFEFDYDLLSTGTVPFTAFTESFDLAGYEFNSEENQLTFIYDARNPQNERIKLSFAAMSFNLLKFEYGEGNLQRTTYKLNGDSIALTLFDAWQSGMVEFENPFISFELEHSYGFPISLRINEVTLSTIDNTRKALVSDQVDKEIALNYPGFSQVGESFVTSIPFDNSNSNIRTLFNEQIGLIEYDVDAIINPDDDAELKGYVTDESFFTLNVDLFVPFVQKITELRIQDTIDIENLFPEEFSALEFKIITQNEYPVNISLDFIFLDENDQEMERLLGNNPLIIEPTQAKTRFINLEASKILHLKNAKKIVVEPIFDSSAISEDFVRFSTDQFLDLKVGLKFKI